MIDPSNITNFHLGDEGLEENILFWVMVAGKKATTTAKNLDRMLVDLQNHYKSDILRPYWLLSCFDRDWQLEVALRYYGFGCQQSKAKSIRQLVASKFDLRTCTVDDLESIHGIGMKTSRCFIMHTRKDSRHAGLDTHVLKWLRYLGYDAPKSTPPKKQYLKLERIFIEIADLLETPPAVLDLAIWNAYSTGKEYSIDQQVLTRLFSVKEA